MQKGSGLKLLLLLSCGVFIYSHAWAQQLTPDIVFDTSVLQALDPSADKTPENPIAKTAADPRQTVQPIITQTPAPAVSKNKPAPKSVAAQSQTHNQTHKKNKNTKTAQINTVPLPARKPVLNAATTTAAAEPTELPTITTGNTPEGTSPKALIATPPMSTLMALNPDVSKSPDQQQDQPGDMNLIAPAAGNTTTTTAAAAATIAPPPAQETEKPAIFSGLLRFLGKAKPQDMAAKNIPEPAPPSIGNIDQSIQTPSDNGQIVMFNVNETQKTSGGLNPAVLATPAAPIVQEQATVTALSETMGEDTAGKSFAWRQDNPKPLYEIVPTPAKRPSKSTVSQSFVQDARKNLVGTYTVMKHEGDQMPAVPKDKVVRQELPAPRLSVADIASDPLASRILNMSPEEVAFTLNKMAPASGAGANNLSREIPLAAKPRIVREMGQWDRQPAKMTADDRIPTTSAKQPASLKTASFSAGPQQADQSNSASTVIEFAAGAVALDDAATDQIRRNIVAMMNKSPDSRVQIMAYSAAADGKETSARRASLSRALSIRSYLISQGIDAIRMDVRAMGISTTSNSPADRVNLTVIDGKKS